MNIILIGMRGSGKTTIGKLLTAKLQRNFAETDLLVEQKKKMKIKDIVESEGWQKFRQIEKDIVAEVSRLNNFVISTGGGIVESEKNVANLKKNGFLVWLTADLTTLNQRIGIDKNRPLLTGANTMLADLQNIYKRRKALYKKAADVIIDTTGKTISEVTYEIMKILPAKI